jgi:hypothetical protein
MIDCVCGRCKRCVDHRRYILNRDKILRRSKIRGLREKYKRENSRSLIDDFVSGRLSLQEFEVELNVN